MRVYACVCMMNISGSLSRSPADHDVTDFSSCSFIFPFGLFSTFISTRGGACIFSFVLCAFPYVCVSILHGTHVDMGVYRYKYISPLRVFFFSLSCLISYHHR